MPGTNNRCHKSQTLNQGVGALPANLHHRLSQRNRRSSGAGHPKRHRVCGRYLLRLYNGGVPLLYAYKAEQVEVVHS